MDESSEDELAAVGGVDNDEEEHNDPLKDLELPAHESHYSDDFFQEIPLDYLFFYHDLNNLHLNLAIQALTETLYWNTDYNHRRATKYVGETYKPIDMK